MTIRKHLFTIMLLIACSINVMAYDAQLISTVPTSGQQGTLSTTSKVLKGMPFTLTMEVTNNGSASFNQWGSALLTTGSAPFSTPSDGFQAYLKSSTNGGVLYVTMGGGGYTFRNVLYNTPKFSMTFVYDGTTMTLTVANEEDSYDASAHNNEAQTRTVTRTMTFGEYTNFSYAIPSNISVSSLSLAVNELDIQQRATSEMAQITGTGIGYPTTEVREEMAKTSLSSDAEALTQYKTLIDVMNGTCDIVLPNPSKVYYICKDGTTWLKEVHSSDDASDQHHGEFETSTTGPADLEFKYKFEYMWFPVQNEAKGTMAFGIGTGGATQYYLTGTTPDGMGSTGTQYAITRGDSWGTLSLGSAKSYTFTEATIGDKTMTLYKVVIQAANSSDASKVASSKVQYVNGDVNAETSNGGVLLFTEQPALSTLSATAVDGLTPVISVSNGEIVCTYSSFENAKAAADKVLTAASGRLSTESGYAAGALFTNTAITTAQTAVGQAQTDYTNAGTDADKIKTAIDELTTAMETFYATIDGRYVTISQDDYYITSTSSTNLSAAQLTGTKEQWYGVYRLSYMGNGIYQMENAYRKTWIGQTTGANAVGSCAPTTAEKWRGAYSLTIGDGKTDVANAYILTNMAGSVNYPLYLDGTTIMAAAEPTSGQYWNVQLVNVTDFASAYIKNAKYGDTESTETEAYKGTIGYGPAKSVTTTLETAKTAYDSDNDESALATAVNTFIDNQSTINMPADGVYVTFKNQLTTGGGYMDEYFHELQLSDGTPDIGNVFKMEKTGDSDDTYYIKSVRTDMYLGKVSRSQTARVTSNEANRCKYAIVSVDASAGTVALHEMTTNGSYSYLHKGTASSLVGWSYSGVTGSQWLMEAVSDENMTTYFNGGIDEIRTQYAVDKALTAKVAAPFYAKTTEITNTADAAIGSGTASYSTLSDAASAYATALAAMNTYKAAGTALADNGEVVLIHSRHTDSNGSSGYYLNACLEDKSENGGSMVIGQTSNTESEYYWSAWVLMKDATTGAYRVYSLFPGYYISKEVSQSSEASGRYALTASADEAALFDIEHQAAHYLTLHRHDYEDQNSGYLKFKNIAGVAYSQDTGVEAGNIMTSTEDCQYEMTAVGYDQYKANIAQLKRYLSHLGTGVGQYTDNTGDYTEKANAIQVPATETDETKAQLIAAAKALAPTLANVTINQPSMKRFYRIYNKEISSEAITGRRYISSKNATASHIALTATTGDTDIAASDIGSVWFWNGTELLSYENGYFIGNTSNNTPWGQGGYGSSWDFTFANTGFTGVGCYSIKPEGRSYLYNNGTSGLDGWGSAYNEKTEWYVEEVNSLPVAISSFGYATLNCPVNLTIPDGITAYIATEIGTKGGKDVVGLVKLSECIPANTPVLLKGTASTTYQFAVDYANTAADDYAYSAADYRTTYTSPVYDGSASEYKNLFVGSVQTQENIDADGAIAWENLGSEGYRCEYMTLQNINSTPGFYGYRNDTRHGFRIFLPSNVAASSEVKSLLFDFVDGESTAISQIEHDASTAESVAGTRKVIVDGKVVILKDGKQYNIIGQEYKK